MYQQIYVRHTLCNDFIWVIFVWREQKNKYKRYDWYITVYKYILSVFHWCWSFSGERRTTLSKCCHEHQHISTMPGHKHDQNFINTFDQKILLQSLLFWDDLTRFNTVTLHLRKQYTWIAAFPQPPANMFEGMGFLLCQVSIPSSCYSFLNCFYFQHYPSLSV